MTDSGAPAPAPLFVFSGGFLVNRRVRAILRAGGWPVRLGWPGRGDAVGVWGRGAASARGRWVASRMGARLVTVEDAFLRSVLPGRAGNPPIGLIVDDLGVHYDPSRPSRLETLIAARATLAPAEAARAAEGIARLRHWGLSKYNAHSPDAPLPEPGFVLVVDQTRGDAAIRCGGATAQSFARMLAAARAEHPDAPIVIRTHPETALGLRPGHFGPADCDARTTIEPGCANPWALLARARAVYVVSSQLGFEAICAGHRPVVFGQPFYAGWGLSDDRNPPPRRKAAVSREGLFHAAMIDAPLWWDAFNGRLCEFETACEQLHAAARAHQEDRRGWVLGGMRLWKRSALQRALGRVRRARFIDAPQAAARRARREGRRLGVWAGRVDADWREAAVREGVELVRIEDGFLRSRGLGAELVPPMSLALDPLGIYYDPSAPSALEALIAASPGLPAFAHARAERLMERIAALGLSKYNVGATDPGLAEALAGNTRPVVVVAGQVEDDASIRTGAQGTATNLGLLQVARAARPDAFLVYKPHPDVEAGLRAGAVADAALERLADAVCRNAHPAALLGVADELWTITSLMGFEALIRGVKVVTLGVPFYAGWGLTEDLAEIPERRAGPVPLSGLVHAALIGYPRYFDPATGAPAPVEVIVERLAAGASPPRPAWLRGLARLQGWFASWPWLWR